MPLARFKHLPLDLLLGVSHHFTLRPDSLRLFFQNFGNGKKSVGGGGRGEVMRCSSPAPLGCRGRIGLRRLSIVLNF